MILYYVDMNDIRVSWMADGSAYLCACMLVGLLAVMVRVPVAGTRRGYPGNKLPDSRVPG